MDRRAIRSIPDYSDEPISAETYEKLLACLERKYAGKWRRAVDVCPVAVNKTIDNEEDALETIRRIEASESLRTLEGKR